MEVLKVCPIPEGDLCFVPYSVFRDDKIYWGVEEYANSKSSQIPLYLISYDISKGIYEKVKLN